MAWCCKSAEECRDSTSRCLNQIDFFQVSELFVSAHCWPHIGPHIYSMYVSYWVMSVVGFGSRVTHCHGSKKTNSVCVISRLDDVRVCWMIEMPRFFSKLARRLGV